jgi:hypothetical protein
MQFYALKLTAHDLTYSATVVPQVSMNTKMRSNAFAAYGALSAYGVGLQRTAFIEQVSIQFHFSHFMLHIVIL